MAWSNPVAAFLFWSAATIAFYLGSRLAYRRWPHWWLSPLLATPALVVGLALALHASYQEYRESTHWLMTLLGPTVVAFAVPIYEQRTLIRRFWPVLLAGVAAGSVTAMATAWGLASLLGLGGDLRLSLLPRSISTPFAMTVSGEIGGAPNLTAVFVIFTGVFGAMLGELLLAWLPLRSSAARGALFGMGAHGCGVAKASTHGREEATIASLVMVLAGLANVLAAPFIASFLG